MSVLIVGAVESTPGLMTVDYIVKEDLSGLARPTVEQVHVPVKEYLACWK